MCGTETPSLETLTPIEQELAGVWSERERELAETTAKLTRALATAESALPGPWTLRPYTLTSEFES